MDKRQQQINLLGQLLSEKRNKKAAINYCPNCGCDVSHKNLGDGNHWECDKCDELVEAYILDKRINGVTIISN